jgi:hypothetical protein
MCLLPALIKNVLAHFVYADFEISLQNAGEYSTFSRELS